jgi:hypothetical protein
VIYIHFDPNRLTRLGWTLATLSTSLFIVCALAIYTQAPRALTTTAFIGLIVVLLLTGLLDSIGDSVHIPEARLRHLAEDAAAAVKDPGADSPP